MPNKYYNNISNINTNFQNLSILVFNLSLAFMVIGLLFSRGLLSIGFLIFIANWIFEGNFKKKWETLKKNKYHIVISIIFLIHLLGLIHTKDFYSGISELKVKLPLLFPLFYFSSTHLLKKIQPYRFLFLFIIATTASSLFAFIRFEFFSDNSSVEDLNQIALVGQNIRLSLFVNLSIFGSIYWLVNKKFSYTFNSILIISSIWLIIFLYLLNSLTGHITFAALFIYSSLYILRKNKFLAFSSLILLFIVSLFLTIHIKNIYHDFYLIESVDTKNLREKTVNGNQYYHNLSSTRVENGNYIDIYICKSELKKEWQKVSTIPYNGKDYKGNNLEQTILRYLSSKGFRKDSVDFQKLNKKDIAYIENGCSNYKYTKKYSLEARVYNILWQLNTYKVTGNATAQSISQRIEFLKISYLMIKKNFWFGVGPGDVMNDFSLELNRVSSKLAMNYHNRVHNQYLVEFVALGVTGFIIFLFSTFFPIFKFKIWNSFIFAAFYIIILLSYFTDNTLETQLGVCFFSVFYSILLHKHINKIKVYNG